MSNAARTYNQDHIARKYTPGERRLSIYWSWSYAWESQRDLTEMENRFSTMTEVRRVAWPNYEKPEWGSAQFLQGIAGTLELFHRSALSFQQIAGTNVERFVSNARHHQLVFGPAEEKRQRPCSRLRGLENLPVSILKLRHHGAERVAGKCLHALTIH